MCNMIITMYIYIQFAQPMLHVKYRNIMKVIKIKMADCIGP